MESISFMPLSSVDPFAGIIITDWYTSQSVPNERCKINIFIKGQEMKTDKVPASLVLEYQAPADHRLEDMSA